MNLCLDRSLLPLALVLPLAWSCSSAGSSDGVPPGGPMSDAHAVGDAAEASPGKQDAELEAGEADVPDGEQEAADAPDVMLDAADATQDAMDAGCPACVVEAVETCTPVEGACVPKEADTTLYASYRKDFYYDQYQEGDVLSPIPAPTSGGRLNVTGVAHGGGKVVTVSIDGKTTDELLAAQQIDWYQVYPLEWTAGEPFWVNFHSRDAAWDSKSTAALRVDTDGGVGYEGAFPVRVNQTPLKNVAFVDDYKTVVLHVEPRTAGAVHLSKVVFNGRDVTSSACVSNAQMAGGVDHLVTIPLCDALKPGDPWTVTLVFDGQPPSTAGGRVLRAFFPIEAWQAESQCPYPMYNGAWFDEHKAHGFDTFFTRPDTPTAACGSYGQPTTIYDLVGAEAVAHDYHVVMTFEADNQFLPYQDVSRIAAAFHADECDSGLLTGGYPKPQTRATLARRAWETWPDLPTYIGGSRLRYNGAFAGATDIQGFDFYVAACAPHITVAGTHPPLRAAFDMLFGVHENHMPHTSWFYTQGLHGGWNANIAGVTIYRQPSPAEYRVQALSVLMAGGKGIMYFQTDQNLAAKFPDTWAETGAVNRDIHGIRPYLLEGDIHRIMQEDGSFIASVLRARSMMALIAINLKTSSSPTELQCLTGQNPHWVLADNAPDITVEVPPDLQVAEVVELRNGQLLPVPYQVSGRSIVFPSFAMSQADAGRIVLLLADSGMKAEIQARMAY